MAAGSFGIGTCLPLHTYNTCVIIDTFKEIEMNADELKVIMDTNEGRADLTGADLREAELTGANLSGANLREAELTGANLRGADLTGADLCGANLSGANLRGVDLRSANLREAELTGANLCVANLSGADLRGANLTGADLRGANLSGANLREAELTGANLRGADLTGADGNYAMFYGGKHVAWATSSHIGIGCEMHTHAEWRQMYGAIGERNQYTPEEIQRYHAWIISLDYLAGVAN